ECEPGEAEHLAVDPDVGRKIAPHYFVEYGAKNEVPAPAHGQDAPRSLIEDDHHAHERLEKWAAELQPAEQDDREQAVDDRWLELYEDVVVENEREAAEDQNDNGRRKRQDRDPPGQGIADGECR